MSEEEDLPEVHPGAAFLDPLFVGALALLVLNDHVLKGAGLVPAVITGKLSDVAGLVVAPLVLAWLMRVRSRRGLALAHLAVGLGFAALQLSPALARALEAGAASLAWPLRIWPDASDLIALPALALSYARFSRPSPPPASRLTLAVGLVALVACTATSPHRPAPRYPFPPRGLLQTDVYVRHQGRDPIEILVYELKEDSRPDCDALLERPERTLGDDDLADRTEWTLEIGDAVPLWDRRVGAAERPCYAVRLEIEGRRHWVAWRHGEPPVRAVEIRLEPGAPEDEEAVRPRGAQAPVGPPGVVIRRPL